MKKRIFSLFLVVVFTFNLFACESKPLVVSDNYKPLEVVSVSDETRKLYDSKTIGLTSVKNARNLGGYVTIDGKKVKDNLLIRCGHLAKINDEDKKVLIEKCGVKEIVDFRTKAEIGQSIDKELEGAHYQKIDIIKEFEGDDPVVTNMKKITGNNSIDMMISYYQNRGTMDDMYNEIVTSDTSHDGYRKFFDILLANDGATIFHCSSGKDRTGFAAAFILSILGVDKKTILDDYEASVVYYEEEMKTVAEELEDSDFTEDDIIEISRLVGVDRICMENALNLIDKEYGGMMEYLHKQIGITDAEMNILRNKYLE